MFGHAPPATGKVAEWLQHLRAVDPSGQAGELMHRNLLEDGNVCDEYRSQATQFIESRPTTVQPHEAQQTYNSLCAHLKANGCGYCDAPNVVNQMPATVFGRFSRVVGAEGFAQYNVTPQAKTNRRLQRRAVGVNLSVNRISVLNGDPRRLVGQIGPVPSFSARSESLQPEEDGHYDADDIRDRLGLDDSRLKRGSWMVLMRFDETKVPGNQCYRPTVLDAGWYPAFLPSGTGPAAPGWTQHLQTGAPGCEEVIIAPFDANQLETFDVVGPLNTDPSLGHRAVRLAASP